MGPTNDYVAPHPFNFSGLKLVTLSQTKNFLSSIQSKTQLPMAATSSSPPCNISVSSLLQQPSCTILKVFGLLPPASRNNRKLGRLTVTRSNLAQDFLGDFGARDPYPEEIASQFGDKVLGCQSTEHKILIPNASVLSLSQLECSPVSPSQPPLSADDARTLLHKVIF